MEFESIVGKEFGLYGVDNLSFKVGRYVFEAIEDECDGYRSCLKMIEKKDPTGLIFFNQSVAKIMITKRIGDPSFKGYDLVDVKDGHIWLEIGTGNNDNYYPLFVFSYKPKKKA